MMATTTAASDQIVFFCMAINYKAADSLSKRPQSHTCTSSMPMVDFPGSISKNLPSIVQMTNKTLSDDPPLPSPDSQSC